MSNKHKPRNVNRFVRLREAVERLIDAEIDSSWSGAGTPEDMAFIELELVKARIAYESALGEVIK